MKRLWKYISPHIGFITLTMVIKLGGTVLELLIPYLMEIILDDIVPTGNTRKVLFFGVLMMLGMDSLLALVLIALLPIICLIVYIVTKKSVPLYKEEQGTHESLMAANGFYRSLYEAQFEYV